MLTGPEPVATMLCGQGWHEERGVDWSTGRGGWGAYEGIRCAVLLGLLCLASPSCTTLTPSEPVGSQLGSVSGTILGSNGLPVPGVTVLLGGTSRRAASGADGVFLLEQVPPGLHRLVIARGATRQVVAARVERGETKSLGTIAVPGAGQAAEPPPPPVAEVESVAEAPVEPEPVEAPASLEELAEAAQVEEAKLDLLAQEAGVDAEAWEAFLATGELPEADAGSFDRKDLLRLAHTAKGLFTKEEASALLAALTGMDAASVREWLEANRDALELGDDFRLSREQLAQAFALLSQTGQLNGELLAALQLAVVPGESGGAEARPGGGAEEERVLYDAALGSLPEDQHWWYLTDPLAAAAVQKLEAGATALDTRAKRTEKAGYFTEDPVTGEWLRFPQLPSFDRQKGFTLSFTAQVVEEKHVRDDRAGFSVLLVCPDLAAIELGFWEDRVWAQADDGNPIFQDSRAESARLDMKSSPVELDLEVQGERYILSAGGEEVLQGALRDYTPYGDYPYTTPNFLFLGDNTTSAQADLRLLRVAFRPTSPLLPVDPAQQKVDVRDAAQLVAAASGEDLVAALQWLQEHAEDVDVDLDSLSAADMSRILAAVPAAGKEGSETLGGGAGESPPVEAEGGGGMMQGGGQGGQKAPDPHAPMGGLRPWRASEVTPATEQTGRSNRSAGEKAALAPGGGA